MKFPAGKLACIEHHTFMTGPLVEGSVVIDAGANVGSFACAVVERYPCRVLALEPHPTYFAAIPGHQRVEKTLCALAGHDGRRRLQLDANPQAARLAANEPGNGTMTDVSCLETLVRERKLTNLPLVKLDIEGTELEVLESLSDDLLSRVAQFTIEFHDFAGYLTTRQVENALEQLHRRGWTSIRFSRRCYGDTLVLNRQLIDLSSWEAWWLRYVTRNTRGVGRLVRRSLGAKS